MVTESELALSNATTDDKMTIIDDADQTACGMYVVTVMHARTATVYNKMVHQ